MNDEGRVLLAVWDDEGSTKEGARNRGGKTKNASRIEDGG